MHDIIESKREAAAREPYGISHLILRVESCAVILVQRCIQLDALHKIWVGQEVTPVYNEVGAILLQRFDASGTIMPAGHQKSACVDIPVQHTTSTTWTVIYCKGGAQSCCLGDQGTKRMQ